MTQLKSPAPFDRSTRDAPPEALESAVGVLMVDDQPSRLLTYEAILSNLRVRCVWALSGTEALEYLLRDEFAVILLDVNMPGMDGFELARLIREHPRLERTPIIFITGVHASELDILRGYEVGAVDYISVPVRPEILRSKVAVLVELHQRRSELKRLNRALADARALVDTEHATVLAQKDAQLRAVFEHPSDLIAVFAAQRDANGAITDWIYRDANANVVALLGRTRDTFLGRGVTEILPERAAATHERGARVLASGQPERYETRTGERDFLVTMFPIAEDLVVTSGVDITDRKRAEAALRESEQRFRELANNIDQFAWTCDHLGLATWYNDRWYEYTGTTFEMMQGEGWRNIHHPAHLPRVLAGLEHAFTSGQPWEDTFPLRSKSGEYRWFLSRAVPIRDQQGHVVRWFGTNTDVTRARELQDALKENDRRKDEFLAMLAHELRNPVAPISNAADVLSRLLNDDDEKKPLVDIVRRQATHLSRLLDDLLDVARITQGRIELRRAVLPLSTCIQQAIETAEPLVRDKAHHLTVSETFRPMHVDADKVRLAQSIANVLLNAAKYTNPGGQIRIQSSVYAGQAVVEISDTGVGLAPELLPKVFDLFVQSERTLDRTLGGLGIGLAVCKQLIEMHGGSVSASSPGVGAGATFTIRLPLAEPVGDTARRNGDVPVVPQRVLIVDDNEDSADSLAILLELDGHEARAVYSAATALDEVATFHPDVVLLDIGLPGMDGYEVARRIKAQPGAPRLVAVSGYGQPEERQRSAAAGFSAHLVKPVDIAALKKALSA